MQKISIKREQSQAGLSFAEREKFRPQVKNKLLLLLALLLTAATGAWAQTVVTIGNGTDTSPFVPYNSSFNNSLEEQIYLASEIGQSGIITAISFNSADDETYNETINVYMKNVTRSSFSSTTDYEPLAASDIVFSGSVTFGKGWKTVTLDTPFEYDNTKNLLICFYKKGSTSYSIYNTYTTQAENRTIAFYHDTNVPDPYNLGSYPKFIKLSATRANIKITIEAGGGGSGSEEASTYTVSFAENTEDAANWTGKAGNGDYQALPLTGVAKGAALTLKYDGTKKVKSVKAVKKAEAPHLVIEDKNNFFGIGNQKFYFTEGETWTEAMANHPENAAAGWVIYNDRLRFKPDVYGYAIFILRSGDYYIIEDTILNQPIDTSKTYMFEGTNPT